MRVVFLLSILIPWCAIAQTDSAPKTLQLASTQWCPYVCNEDKGAVIQYVDEILARENIKLTVQVLPWSRAIKQAKSGASDGLLTAGLTEAQALSYTHSALGYYQTCFIARQDSTWHYEKPLNIKGEILGTVQGYGYGPELDNLIKTRPASVLMISGSKVVSRLIGLLNKKRIDIVAIDIREFKWILGSNFIEEMGLKKVGCLAKEPYYLALNPALIGREQLIEILDIAFAKSKNKHRLQQLLEAMYYKQTQRLF
ncbi:MAG: hypothetical protein HRU23_05770 [Gammaproteobacteria bacterium]|nr:hypothetical protein [Gammaproteobacteria bacterium]